MTKSYVEELVQVYDALLKDAEYAYPELADEFKHDRTSLARAVEQRGLPVFLTDLPAAGKHLDRCLSTCEYKTSGLPLTRRVSRSIPIPKMFRGLYLLVFDSHGRLKGVPDEQAIMFLRTLLYCAKKATVDCPDRAVRTEVRAFLDQDAALPEPSGFWAGNPSLEDVPRLSRFETAERYAYGEVEARKGKPAMVDPTGKGDANASLERDAEQCLSQSPGKVLHDTLLSNLDHVAGIVISTLGRFSFLESDFKHGPGAVSDVQKGSSKYTWVNWPARLEREFPLADCGYSSWLEWAKTSNARHETRWVFPKTYPLVSEPASRLIAVPKTYSKPRLIAAEPAAMQWCQQNVKHFLYDRIEHSWIGGFIRFTDQTHNQELALRGSKDGSLVTIDLSSASDRISCLAVECLFKSSGKLLLALQATRTRFLSQSFCEERPMKIELKKFSTMGSACTFPVQSLLFFVVSIAAVLTARGKKPSLKNIQSLLGDVTIFGDDIIVPEDSRKLLIWGLESLDFKVNTDKSYWEGNFRESCGVDAFAGVDVTPAYWHAPYDEKVPASLVSTVETANNFQKRFLVTTAGVVTRMITKWQLPLVRSGAGDPGLWSFTLPDIPKGKTRWNRQLQRHELLVATPVGKLEKSNTWGHERLLQYFTEDPDPTEMWESGINVPEPDIKIRLKWRPLLDYTQSLWNPSGGDTVDFLRLHKDRLDDYYSNEKEVMSRKLTMFARYRFSWTETSTPRCGIPTAPLALSCVM